MPTEKKPSASAKTTADKAKKTAKPVEEKKAVTPEVIEIKTPVMSYVAPVDREEELAEEEISKEIAKALKETDENI